VDRRGWTRATAVTAQASRARVARVRFTLLRWFPRLTFRPSPAAQVKGVPVAPGSASRTWAFVAMCASVVIIPVIAVLAKEIIH
jgi:hypothetical protein